MSALASSICRQYRNVAAAEMPFPVKCEETSMREKLGAVRDTLLVLALQLVFRATQAMRSWNY